MTLSTTEDTEEPWWSVCVEVGSPLKCVRQLDEEVPPGRLQPSGVRQLAVVAVADEHHRLPVQFVRKQDRAAEGAGAVADRRPEQRRIARRGDVLADGADEHA